MATLRHWLEACKSNPLAGIVVGAIVGALLTRFIPFLWGLFQPLFGWIGKKIGGRFAHRHFEKEYLNWLAISVRELKLAGVVTYDDVKKPQLEQVFVSIRVGEHRETASAAELAGLLAELFYRNHRDVRACFEHKELLELIGQKLGAFDADQFQATEDFVLRELESRRFIRAWARDVYRRLRPRTREELLADLLSSLPEMVRRSESHSASHDDGAGQLRRVLRTNERIAVLGAPGAGKTTLLQYVALTYARERAGDRKLCRRGIVKERLGVQKWRVPIFVPLISIAGALMGTKPDGTERSIADVLHLILPPDLQGDPIAPKYFLRQLERGDCIVLLDGLDEVATEPEFRTVVRAIESMAVKYGGNRFLLTSREAGWRGGVGADFSIFYVNDLTDRQVDAFIDSWYTAVERNAVVGRLEDEGHTERKERARRAMRRASELKSTLKENIGIRRLATNPMLLSIIALVHRSLATLPKERGKLYAECTKILLEQWDISRGLRVDDTNLKLDQKEAFMRRLAIAFHRGEIGEKGGGREAPRKQVEEILSNVLPSLGRPMNEAPRLLQRLIERSGLITERRRDVLAFAHLTFQEYFAAQNLACADPQESCEFLLDSSRLLSDWWHEVILLFAGLLPDSSALVARIHDPSSDDAFRRRLRLAGLCLAEATAISKQDVRQAVTSDLLKVRTCGAVEAIDASIFAQVQSYLVKWSTGDGWYTSAVKASALGAKDRRDLARQLFDALGPDARHSDVSVAALRNLPSVPVDMISEEIVGRILSLLQSKSQAVRLAAAESLAGMTENHLSESGVLILMNALREESSSPAGDAMVKLLARQGGILLNDSRVQASLNGMFSDQRAEARTLAAQAFETYSHQATPAQVEAFLKLTTDSDHTVRWKSSQVLNRTINQLPPDIVIPRLLKLLNSRDDGQRSFAVAALGRLTEPAVTRHKIVDTLAPLVTDSKLSEAARASLTLLAGNGMFSEVSALTVRWLYHSKAELQVAAMEIIRNLGSPAATSDVISRLLALVISGHSKVRSDAALTLGQVGDGPMLVRTIGTLNAASHDRKTEVRENAVRALGRIASKVGGADQSSAATIISMLRDPRLAVRAAAAAAVAQLSPQVVSNDTVEVLIAFLTHKGTWQKLTGAINDIRGSDSEQPFWALGDSRWFVAVDPERAFHRFIYRRNFLLSWGFSGVPRRQILQAAAASALAAIGLFVATRRILDVLKKFAESERSAVSMYVQLRVLEAIATLGSRTMPDYAFGQLVELFTHKPLLAQATFSPNDAFILMDHDVELAYPYFGRPYVYFDDSDRTATEIPLVTVGRKAGASLVADRLRGLAKESSLALRILALRVIAALGDTISNQGLAEAVSRNLLDEEYPAREFAWTIVERHLKRTAA